MTAQLIFWHEWGPVWLLPSDSVVDMLHMRQRRRRLIPHERKRRKCRRRKGEVERAERATDLNELKPVHNAKRFLGPARKFSPPVANMTTPSHRSMSEFFCCNNCGLLYSLGWFQCI